MRIAPDASHPLQELPAGGVESEGENLAPRIGLSRLFLRALRTDLLFTFGLAVLLLFTFAAVFAPAVAPHDPLQINPLGGLSPPSHTYLLGTDENGRDILSRLIYGAR